MEHENPGYLNSCVCDQNSIGGFSETKVRCLAIAKHYQNNPKKSQQDTRGHAESVTTLILFHSGVRLHHFLPLFSLLQEGESSVNARKS